MTGTPSTDGDDRIARAQRGDRDAFGQLAAELGPRLVQSARALCRDDRIAEDLAQETLVECWRSAARFDGRCAFSTWMHGILRHRFLKLLRRGRSRPALHLLQDAPDPPDEEGASPAALAEQNDRHDRLRRAVAALPEDQRRVVEMRFFGDASLQDIATALDCPEGTVKSRLHHALRTLREKRMNLSGLAGESGVNP